MKLKYLRKTEHLNKCYEYTEKRDEKVVAGIQVFPLGGWLSVSQMLVNCNKQDKTALLPTLPQCATSKPAMRISIRQSLQLQ